MIVIRYRPSVCFLVLCLEFLALGDKKITFRAAHHVIADFRRNDMMHRLYFEHGIERFAVMVGVRVVKQRELPRKRLYVLLIRAVPLHRLNGFFPTIFHCFVSINLSANASNCRTVSSVIAILTVTHVSKIVMSLYLANIAVIHFAAVGAQLPFSMSATVRF